MNQRTRLGILFIVPTLILMGVTIIYPLFTVFLYSVQDVGLATTATSRGEFIGTDNFGRVLSSSAFPTALTNSFVIATSSVILCVLIGMGIALLLNTRFPGRTVARSLVILPWAMPAFVAAFAWRWILDFQYGAFNNVVLTLFPESGGIAVLSNPTTVLPVAIGIYVWKGLPWTILVLLAGLQVVPEDQREAARVDGASKWQEFRHVVLPSLTFVVQITVTLLFIWNFNWFDLMWLLTKGGPGTSTLTLPIQVYLQAFQAFNTGYASALGVIILGVVVVCAAFVFRVFRRQTGAI
jgi:ABC-type sugar transport system permease subunit